MIKPGAVFEYWTVVEQISKSRFKCICRCGTVKELYGSGLEQRKSVSCGCMRRGRVPQVGDVLAEWTIIAKDPESIRRVICKCSCGTEKSVEIYTLGKVSRSCGHDRVRTAVEPRAPRRGQDSAPVPTDRKRCSVCRNVLPLEDFHKDRYNADGRRSRCKKCVKGYDDETRETRNARMRALYRLDPKKKISKTSAYRRLHPFYGDIRERVCRGGGIYYEVTPEQLTEILAKYNDSCYICEIDLTEGLLHWDHYHPVGRGGDHSVDNLKPACAECNHRKWAFWPITEDQLSRIAQDVWALRTAE